MVDTNWTLEQFDTYSASQLTIMSSEDMMQFSGFAAAMSEAAEEDRPATK